RIADAQPYFLLAVDRLLHALSPRQLDVHALLAVRLRVAAGGIEERQRLLDHEVRDVDLAEARQEGVHGGARVGTGRGGHRNLCGQEDSGYGAEHESVIRARYARSQRKASIFGPKMLTPRGPVRIIKGT